MAVVISMSFEKLEISIISFESTYDSEVGLSFINLLLNETVLIPVG